MANVYRKVMVADRLPKEGGWYFTDSGMNQYSSIHDDFYASVKWWLEEIELPTDGDIWGKFESDHRRLEVELIKKGANFIKNHIEKGGKG